jgi:hypothetical protein
MLHFLPLLPGPFIRVYQPQPVEEMCFMRYIDQSTLADYVS